jgi:hypothetical protein
VTTDKPSRRSILRAILAAPVALVAPLGWLWGCKAVAASGLTCGELIAAGKAFRAQWKPASKVIARLGEQHQTIVFAFGLIMNSDTAQCSLTINPIGSLIPAVPPGFKRTTFETWTVMVGDAPENGGRHTIGMRWKIVDEEIISS